MKARFALTPRHYYAVACVAMGTLVLQIDSEKGLDWMWGDNGVAFLFQCAQHPARLGFTWQCA